ncbi:hypothetical protein BESB_061280 [Besnoitia besnoiti]|uniref:Transmembrane protein n=1 Tax=Besnoitia besnoiti TaxID=94643 RepID=A0A2A9MG37_BESBE|nr:hypothetical protein BESB_061280 [Besnoitia besnoiti]PFH35241.1 hypothetical protein BESB_061280 [Besnoitia besnoiti]
MDTPPGRADVRKKTVESNADRFSYPLVVGSTVIAITAALFALCLGFYVTCVCWMDVNGGILFTGRGCTLHQRVVGPIAIIFGTFGVSATLFILCQGFVTPRLLAVTLASLGGGGPAAAWNWVDVAHR